MILKNKNPFKMIKNPSTPNEIFQSPFNKAQFNVLPNIESKPVRILKPLIVCGPSGTGKTTLLKKLMSEFEDCFGFSISRMYLFKLERILI